MPTVNSSLDGNASTHRGVQNGAHIQPQLHGMFLFIYLKFSYINNMPLKKKRKKEKKRAH